MDMLLIRVVEFSNSASTWLSTNIIDRPTDSISIGGYEIASGSLR